MSLFELKQEDFNDIWALIAGSNLTITANNAKRVAELQTLCSTIKPSTALEECRARCDKLEREVQECLRVRDNALLEAGVAKRRVDELEHELGNTACTQCHMDGGAHEPQCPERT